MVTGVFDHWIDTALRMAEYDGTNSVNDRIAAITFLADIWELRADNFEGAGADTA